MLYYAYGSNTNPDQMRRRCPGAVKVGPLVLPHGKLVFRGVADIVYCENSHIAGAVWRINKSHERALDQFEGVAQGMYKKKYIRLSIKGGESEPCLFYAMRNKRGVAPPSEQYFNTILEGFEYFKLDQDMLYAALDASWDNKALTPDIRRRRVRQQSVVQR
jgi:gamma-glutamylcyclotransferase (GGCT)/AIG2-like uncharacterized protein YtfP